MNEKESLLPQFRLFSFRSALGLGLAVLSVVLQLIFGGWILSASVFAAAFFLLGLLRFRLPAKAELAELVPIFLCASFVSFWASQYAQSADWSRLSFLKICFGVLICAIVLLFFLLLTARPFWGICIGMVLLQFLATVNYYVAAFRGTEFTPLDILSVKTAANIAGDYDFTPTLPLVRAWLVVVLFLFGLSALHFHKLPRLQLSRVSIPLLMAMLISLVPAFRLFNAEHFFNDGVSLNGFFLNFVLEINQSIIRKPSDYDPAVLMELQFHEDLEPSASSPTIIVIMNESFADLSVIGPNFQVDEEPIPFFLSLNENTTRGFAYASVFGGGTANSEFEFLTGHSMAFLPLGSSPYQQYLRGDIYSILLPLKERGYSCVAMHPYYDIMWNRRSVYPRMGFDEIYFLPFFQNAYLLRDKTSDRGMFETLIRYYEQRDRSSPLFLFGITVQNHGDYLYDNTLFPSQIHLAGMSQSFPDVEQYLTLIHESDAALSYLIEYFSGVDEDVVILFFGDHMPQVSQDFYRQMHSVPTETFEDAQKEYLVPYIIWTNFDSPEQTLPITSLNYLSNYVFEAAGIPLPPYNKALQQIQQRVPAINSFGFYSPVTGHFLPLSEAAGEEAEAILLYEQLQYNAVFDTKNRLPIFSAATD